MRLDCDDDLRTTVKARLDNFERHAAADETKTAAAVALPIVEHGHGADVGGMPAFEAWQRDAALLLTRRSSRLKDHPGQWALPGGRVESGESLVEAALRELDEEVGMTLDDSAVLGLLDDYVTRSGFCITPVVVWIGNSLTPAPNPAEVDSVHRIPVSEFLRDDAPILDQEGEANPVLRMPVGNTWIAAPTAALLYQFREVCIRDEPTRVAHFDQPRFAWR